MKKRLANPALNQLALSRAAIALHMQSASEGSTSSALMGNSVAGVGADMLKHGVKAWWQKQPAQVVTSLAASQIKQFAKEHPFKLLGIALGVGAAATLVKPSRWINAGLGAMALANSFDLTNLVSSLMNTHSAGDSVADDASKK